MAHKIKVLQISTECYPAAKAGGMGDVVGALPLYLPGQGIESSVVIPRYKRKWFEDHSFVSIHSGTVALGERDVQFEIQKLASTELGYPFYCVNIPGLFDREDIYLADDGHGYPDEKERYISFQLAILHWLTDGTESFDVLHCHDHMTGLITFLMQYCEAFRKLKDIPTAFTIHNGEYRGVFGWEVMAYFPWFEEGRGGLLDWDGDINSLATALKCAWKVNTVSPAYMQELIDDMGALTPLIRHEQAKCLGIINGIDDVLWNPETDKYLKNRRLVKNNWKGFKSKNKTFLLKKYDLKARRPLIGFIGRMAHQKGADILIESVEQCLAEGMKFSTVVLGSGDKQIETSLVDLAKKYPRDIGVTIAYDEKLARAIYAGCDFLMMPSRFEPCGLNQMYSMRYGTVPIVSHVGGLKDTVPDINDNGYGIVARSVDAEGFKEGIQRAIAFYGDKSGLAKHIKKITKIDYSWNNSASQYAEMYRELLKN
ncbi:MAG: glycogen/starch synthase [Bacteroidota bacterium]